MVGLDNNPIAQAFEKIKNDPVKFSQLRAIGLLLRRYQEIKEEDKKGAALLLMQIRDELSELLGVRIRVIRDMDAKSCPTFSLNNQIVLRRMVLFRVNVSAYENCLAVQKASSAELPVVSDARFCYDHEEEANYTTDADSPQAPCFILSEFISGGGLIAQRKALAAANTDPEDIRRFALNWTIHFARVLSRFMQLDCIYIDTKPGNLVNGLVSDPKALFPLTAVDWQASDSTMNCGAMRGGAIVTTSAYTPRDFTVNAGRYLPGRVFAKQLGFTLYELVTGSFEDERIVNSHGKPDYSHASLSNFEWVLLISKIFSQSSLAGILQHLNEFKSALDRSSEPAQNMTSPRVTAAGLVRASHSPTLSGVGANAERARLRQLDEAAEKRRHEAKQRRDPSGPSGSSGST